MAETTEQYKSLKFVTNVRISKHDIYQLMSRIDFINNHYTWQTENLNRKIFQDNKRLEFI